LLCVEKASGTTPHRKGECVAVCAGWRVALLIGAAMTMLAGREVMAVGAETMHPHLLVTGERVGQLRTVEEPRHAVAEDGHARELWEFLLQQAEADLGTEPVAADGRNPSYQFVHSVAQRIMRGALVALVTGDERYCNDALAQIECLFDDERWPDWRDEAHRGRPLDLRTGQFARAIGFAYDWMYHMLDEDERQMIVAGLDRRAIQPFWEAVDKGIYWTRGSNNWSTVIVGGLGIAGMALGSDHPDGQRLAEYSAEQMRAYLQKLGPEGEFNESVGYSSAIRLPALYFAALRYHSGGAENVLGEPIFVDACRWVMYQTVPPGRTVPFGDSQLAAPPPASAVAAVAAASRDGVLQWFYLQNADPRRMDMPILTLMTFDDRIEPQSPEGRMPHGRVYEAFGALISSRTAWEPWSEHGVRCIVHSKAGIEPFHEHHDAGQVVVNGFGERLIVDLGSPASGYPADYGHPTRWNYYNASSWGHNVLNVVGKEMHGERNTQGEVLAAFDDALGGIWRMELTRFYPGADSVTRTVVHLQPGIVAVLDEASFDAPEEIRLRWHTVDRCEPEADGSFTVRGERARAISRLVRLDGDELTVIRDEHAYEPPYHLTRYGHPQKQRNESFVEAQLHGRQCRLLTAFAVCDADEESGRWERTTTGLRMRIGDRIFTISADDGLTASVDAGRAAWSISSREVLAD